MQLPSLEYILTKAFSVIKRFSLALLAAVLAGIAAAYLAGLSSDQPENLLNVLLTAILGIPLFTVLQLASEKRDWGPSFWFMVNGAGLVILVLYYFILPQSFDQAPVYHIYRYFLYLIGFHLLVAVGPFLSKDDVITFWQYNKTLFLRFLTSVLFTTVLFIGLSVALLSIDALLGIEIEDETYLQLLALLAFIFNTWFFLAGVPSSFTYFSTANDYPKSLKIFTQNILIPLVIIYLIILYLYTGKILLQWSWPEGWVSNLVLVFSIVGILAILLLYPIRNKSENRWIKRFSSSYFWALVPLVILLMLAIWRRIWEYGFTIERYFVLTLGLWLTGIVLYFIFSKGKNIKVIPASLCLVAFLISFGPWGAFSVSERSQIDRLQMYLQHNNLLKKGIIQPASDTIPFEDRREISNIVRYLVYNHGTGGIQPWFKQDLTKPKAEGEVDKSNTFTRHEQSEYIAKLIGIEYLSRWESRNRQNASFFSVPNSQVLMVEGYDLVIRNVSINANKGTVTINLNDQKLIIDPRNASLNFRIYLQDQGRAALTIDADSMVTQLLQNDPSKNYEVDPESLTVSSSNDEWKAKVYFRNIDWEKENSKYILVHAQFDLLLSLNKK